MTPRARRSAVLTITSLFLAASLPALAAEWPAPVAPAVPQADGFVVIPGAKVPPVAKRQYRAIYDATRAAEKPDALLPAINMAGSEYNALAASGVPLGNAHFVVVFHGAALDGILTDAAYRAKYGISNPNLPALAAMKKAGAELYVCGQNLAFARIDPKTLTSDVQVASDALIVLMTYLGDGYALLSF